MGRNIYYKETGRREREERQNKKKRQRQREKREGERERTSSDLLASSETWRKERRFFKLTEIEI